MSLNTEFAALIEQYKDNLDYLSEGVLIDVTEQFLTQMEEKHITRTQLAKKLNCSNAYVTKLLNGSENLTLKKLVQIAHVLGCSIDFAILPKEYDMKRYITINQPPKIDKTGYTKIHHLGRANMQHISELAAFKEG